MAGGKLPVRDSRRVVRALERAGFVVDRVVGSHHVMVFPGDAARTVTVPVHSGRNLKPPRRNPGVTRCLALDG